MAHKKMPSHGKRLGKQYTWGLTQKTGKRKGTYLWFKQQGARNRLYWKYDPTLPLDLYHVAIKSRIAKQPHNVATLKRAYREEQKERGSAAWRRYRNYLGTARRRGTLNTAFRPGITAVEEFDPYNMNLARTRELHRRLFSNVILDNNFLDKHLDLLIQNASKMRHRFSFETIIYGTKQSTGEEGELGVITEHGTRDLNEYLNDYLTNSGYQTLRRGHLIGTEWEEKTTNFLRLGADNVRRIDDGHITRVRTRVTFGTGR